MPIASARSLAHRVLMRVADDDAWAERALHGALTRTPLAGRDAALATELVYGTLRNERWIDFVLGAFANKPLKKLPRAVLVALRMSVYQLLFTRIPDHPVVNDGVSLVRAAQPRLGGLANALLRKVARAHEAGSLPSTDDRFDDPLEALAVRGSHPTWLVKRVAAQLGPEEVAQWVDANNQPPPLSLRVNPLRTDRESLLERLRERVEDVVAPEEFPGAVLIRGAGRVDLLPGFAEGHFVVQDPGAQLAGKLAGVKAGDVVLDACAAPGGKSTHLAEMMNNEGMVLAIDVHRAKTRLIADNAARLGLDAVRPDCADASVPDQLQEALERHDLESVDVAVIDAPCSGFGTLRRNPELRRRSEREISRLTQLQRALLDNVASVVRPGGALLYVVCSILPEEGEEQVRAFMERHPQWTLGGGADPLLAPYFEHDMFTTWPHRHGVDGFFAARLQRPS